MKLDYQIEHAEAIARLVGPNDRNLKVFKQYMNLAVSLHGKDIVVSGGDEQKPLLNQIFNGTASRNTISLCALCVCVCVCVTNLGARSTVYSACAHV